MKRKYLVIVAALIAVLGTALGYPALNRVEAAALMATKTIIKVSPSAKRLVEGQKFTLRVYFYKSAGFAGAQVDVLVDPAAIRIDSVEQGALFSGDKSYFLPGTITQDGVKNIAGVTLGNGVMVKQKGYIAIIHCTALRTGWIGKYHLDNVLVGNIYGQPIVCTEKVWRPFFWK